MSRRTCRYFAQSGYCFYGDACQFLHDSNGGTSNTPTEAANGSSKPRQFQESDSPSSLSASASQASYAAKAAELPLSGVTSGLSDLDLAGSDPTAGHESMGGELPSGPTTAGMATTSMVTIGDARYDEEQDEDGQQAAALLPHMDRGTTYFVPLEEEEPGTVGSNIPTTVFPGAPPFLQALGVKADDGPKSYFASSEIAEELAKRQMLSFAQPVPDDEPVAEVEQYNQLYRLGPLDHPSTKQFSSRLFHFPSNCYKALSVRDGQPYCLRHIIGYRLSSTASMVLIEKWRKLSHPNVCALRELFTTKAFGDSSLVFIHDYRPGAETMLQRYFNSLGGPAANPSDDERHHMARSSTPATQAQSSSSSPVLSPGLKGPIIWNFVIQLASAVRAVHNAGLACRVIHPSKILVTGKSRLHLSGVGIMDILTFDIGHTDQSALMQQHQQEDLTALGGLILCLTCNSILAVQSPHAAIDMLGQHYSGDLKNIVIYLLNPQLNRSINSIMPMIGARFFGHLDALVCQVDVLEVELMKELQNGRLFRLLCKFGLINERPEFAMDPQWSETGDRYLLKLFRDYLFHQVNSDGMPWFDLSHIVHCLNQLDSGSPAKICLESRDEQSVIIVSYHDLKQCFEMAVKEVSSASVQPGMGDELDQVIPDSSADASLPYN
eukprot:scpid54890/ scgid12538/ PAB-dependent poly(A)-specific ribonuclease subunit 3